MKIISFSLWGKKPYYIQGAFENVKLQQIYYPDWKCRFYYDETVPLEDIYSLLRMGAQCFSMPKSDGNYGMFWRFSPLDDMNVKRFIVRDTDCRLNPREADAVREWEESGKPFHIMRDNKWHNVVPICGGMWGATSEFRPNYQKLLTAWLAKNQHRIFGHQRGKYFFIDQSFLQESIWPLIVNKHIAHESVQSQWGGDKRPFKVENEGGMFVGQGIDL
jgi:hypothetical protein